ncbi:phospholipase A2 inhibitor gamma subunit A-like [Anomaloglossus baeobatrachus]|uniref:phospholipase A2 inhibitor gamma subunit A-like n=1 Tax=Anomaloglossus baeobatrachus TaxID=238106 RepID=UPI003F4FA745
MKSVTINFFLVFFSLHIATARKCYHCHERNSDTCKEEVIECPEGDQCMTISEEYKLNGTQHSLFKGCSLNMPCNVTPYGRANDHLHLLINTKCCDKDFCNEKFYEMPEDDEPNGIVCPSCLEFNTVKECVPDKEIMCRAMDDKCITFAATVKQADGLVVTHSTKGCMSELGCELDFSQLIGVRVLNQTIRYCNQPNPPSEEEDKEAIKFVAND